MKPAIEHKMVSYGCLLAFVGVCVFGYLAVSSRWTYLLGALGLIAGWSLLRTISEYRFRQRHLTALKSAFAQWPLPLPEFKAGHMYGFRRFTLTFASEAELKQAEASGCVSAFKQAIQSIYAHIKVGRRAFDADEAGWATYDGWVARMRAHVPPA